jgi:hypothetical protein
MAAIFDIPMTEEEYYMGDGGEPSEHEKLIEQKRMERLLKSQIKKYGEDAMRVEPAMAVGASTLPTEDFQRSFQMRMPGVKHAKAQEKDPLASLLKAMKLDKNTGTKKNRGSAKGDKDGGEAESGRTAGQPTEELALLAR